jgi:WD40 repeat protein
MSSVAAPASPFKGLAAFGDSDLDALLFFGRARETEVIAANLQASRLTVLFGPSGVGKSSVLRAGVTHRLRKELDAAVEIVDSWSGDAAASVRAAVAAKPHGGDLYLILDQFEEYFLYHADDEDVPGLLADIVAERGLRVNVLIGIRDDSLARLDTFRRPIPNLLANRLQLDRLDRESARAAILGPVERYNGLTGEDVSVEPELVEAVLDEVTAGRVDLGRAGRGGVETHDPSDRVEAPYLQLVLERLWEAEREAGSERLRVETLRRLGGAARVVQDHLEHAMAELTPAEKEAAAAMYNHLVTPSGTKIAYGVGDLAGYASVAEDEAASVLTKLVRERIVRASSHNGPAATRYEIFHDVLADAVLAWRARHEEQQALRVAEERRRRALRIATAALAGLVVVAAIAVYALLERSHSNAEARRAHAREFAAAADATLATDPRAGVRLALQAARLEPGAREEDVLREALASSKQRAVLRAPRGITAAVFDPRGTAVLAGSRDGKARLYGAGGGRVLHVFDHGAPVTVVGFSPDGNEVLTAGRDGIARVWNVGGTPRLRLAAGGPVRAAFFAVRGKLVATLTQNGWIALWRTRDGRLLWRIRTSGRALPISGAIDPRGRILATVSHDRFARVYSVANGGLLASLPHRGFVHSVAFSPNGRFLLTASHDRLARLWSTSSLQLVRVFKGPGGAIVQAVFSPDGRLVAGASTDGTARVWETSSGFQLAVLLGHATPVTAVAFDSVGGAVVTGSSDGAARTWLWNGHPEAALAGHTDGITSVSFSPNGRSVLTTSADGTARIWDPGTENELRLRVRQRAPFTSLAVGASGTRIVAGDEAGFARVRSLDGKVLRTLRVRGRVTGVAFGPAGARAVAAPVLSIAFSPDGRLEATGRAGGIVRLRSLSGGAVRTLHARGGGVDAVAFSRDSRLLSTGTNGGVVQVWDVDSGRPQVTFPGHMQAVTSVAFSPDGRQLLTASLDDDVRLWDTVSGAPLALYRWHFGPVASATFARDGQFLLTAGPGTAGLGLVAAPTAHTFLHGHSKPLAGAVFAGRDGRLVVTAGRDGTIRAYRCDVLCGGVEELIRIAEQRLGGAKP